MLYDHLGVLISKELSTRINLDLHTNCSSTMCFLIPSLTPCLDCYSNFDHFLSGRLNLAETRHHHSFRQYSWRRRSTSPQSQSLVPVEPIHENETGSLPIQLLTLPCRSRQTPHDRDVWTVRVVAGGHFWYHNSRVADCVAKEVVWRRIG